MGDVVDVRPDRFLREMREHGDADIACTNSGLAHADLDALCKKSRKFDIARVECFLEFLEEKMQTELQSLLKDSRARAYASLEVRHGSR